MKSKKHIKLNTFLGLAFFLFFAASPYFAFAQATKEEIISLVNQERQKAGLDPLVESPTLNQAAALKAQDMVGNNYFAHTSPEGLSPWHWFEKANYPYKYAGENLAMDFTSASSAMRAWMKSPTHKENIVSSKYKEIGIAVLSGIVEEKETLVAVQLFGTRLSDQVEVAAEFQEEEPAEVDGQAIIIKEASARPWIETEEDEVLVYAKVAGNVRKVEAKIQESFHPLLKHEEGVYMGLFSLDGVDLGESPISIEAEDERGRQASYQIPKSNYQAYFEKKEEIQQQPETNQTQIMAQREAESAYQWRNFMKQNIFLAVALALFLIMIGNVWVLEKEEQQLIENLKAV